MGQEAFCAVNTTQRGQNLHRFLGGRAGIAVQERLLFGSEVHSLIAFQGKIV